MRIWTLFAACFFFATGGLLAQDAPVVSPPGIAWENDYDRALARAAKENRPLMVAFVMKDEPANEAMMREHFQDKDIIAFSRNFVCLVACQGLEGDREGPRTDGSVGPVAEKLGAASAAEIRSIEAKARIQLLEASRVSCPQFLFLSPDAKTQLLRHVWTLPKAALLGKMKAAYSFHAPDKGGDVEAAAANAIQDAMKKAVDEDPAIRRPALEILSNSDDPRVMPFLTKRTEQNLGVLVRSEAIFFGMGKKDQARALETLHRLLQDKDAVVRMHAAIATGKVGLIDSIPHLQKALRQESQDRVRSHFVRALAICLNDNEELGRSIVQLLKFRGTAEGMAVLNVAKLAKPNEAMETALRKLMSAKQDEIRLATYVAAGTLDFSNWEKPLKAKLRTEKDEVLASVQWALSRMGGEPYEGESDPEALAYDAMPDNHLWEGDFEAPAREGDGRGGRGGGGGGRGGRGGGRGRGR